MYGSFRFTGISMAVASRCFQKNRTTQGRPPNFARRSHCKVELTSWASLEHQGQPHSCDAWGRIALQVPSGACSFGSGFLPFARIQLGFFKQRSEQRAPWQTPKLKCPPQYYVDRGAHVETRTQVFTKLCAQPASALLRQTARPRSTTCMERI